MEKTKLIIFDMEGTLFKRAVSINETKVAPSAWYAVAQGLGQAALDEEKQTQEKWKRGEYSGYVAWMEDTIIIHKKYGLTKKLFCKILDNIDYVKGVKETLSVINSKNIRTCLISGGFKYQGDRAVADLRIKHSFVGCEYFWDSKGYLSHWNLLPADGEGKLDFVKLLIKEYGFSVKDCVFIGDGENDIPIAKEMGVSISFNGAKELASQATFAITQKEGEEDFRDVLKFLNT